MNGRIVLLCLVSSFLVLLPVTAASAQTRTAGVNIGNKFRYTTTPSWSSDDPTATPPFYIVDYNDTQWVETSIAAISGTNITGQSTKHYRNGTETVVTSWVDVYTGEGSLTSFFISANLTVGDLMYISPFFTQTINQTVPRTYLGGVRDTNHINTTSFGMSNTTYSLYWDKSTGVLVDLFTENTYQTGTYITSWSVEIQIVSSALWAVPESFVCTLVLLMLIVLMSIICQQTARDDQLHLNTEMLSSKQ